MSPSRHSVNTVSVRISNSVPCGLGRPPWSPTPWSPLAGALAPSCTLQRRCRWLCSAPSCSGTYVRAAHAAPTPRSRRDWWHLASRCCIVRTPGRARASAPLPTACLGRSPHWPRHSLFRNTDKRRMPSIIRASSLSTQRWAGGPHSVICFTVHSVMGRRPTLSTQ